MKIPKITRLSITPKLTKHKLYKSAKTGSINDARALVSDIVSDTTPFSKMKGFVCPVIKASGNKIPLALAELMAQNSRLELWPDIILKHEKHGSSMAERLFYEPEYSGHVLPGNYVIVDDVFTSGRTMIALKRFIEKSGGNVIAAFAIGSSSALSFEPEKYLLKTLLHQFPDITKMIDINLLTNPQLMYLLKLNNPYQVNAIHNYKLLENYNC